MKKKKILTKTKAKKMLEDNSAQGKPLSKKQKAYFGMIASGKRIKKRK